MLELAAKPYSWWFESHTSPRRSVWLQSQISELDEKTKAMLKVIEEDADSFAQRAEMYYKRRPELVTMIGDFYRMHRSVAERFDQLKSEARIRLITPFCSSFQTQKLMNQMEKKPFDNSYSRNYDSGDGGQSEVDDPEQEEESRVNRGMEAEDCDESEVDDPETEEKTNVDEDCGESEVDDPEHEEELQVDQEGEVSSLNSERRVMKLRQEIEKLKEENRIQKGQLMGEYSSLILEIEAVKLRDEIERLKDENTTLREKLVGEFSCLIYKGEVEKLRNEIVILKNEHRIQKEQLIGKLSRGMMIQESEVAKLRDEIERLKEENRIQKEELLGEFSGLIHESKVAKLRDEIERLGKENRRIQKEQQLLGESFPTLIGDSEEVAKLKEELERAKEENRVQKEQLCQKDEEKREVIRQLSFSLDVLKENLSSSKKKKGVVNESTKKWTPFEFNKLKGLVSAKLFGGYSIPSQSNPVVSTSSNNDMRSCTSSNNDMRSSTNRMKVLQI